MEATIYVAGGGPGSLASLTVNGTQANPVTFTSLRDDSVGGDTNGDGAATVPMPGDWQAIHFDTYSAGSLNYADVRYGGSAPYGYDGAIHAVSNGSLAVTNSSFTNNANSGVRIASTGAATLTGNTFIVPDGAKAASMTVAADVSASGNTASGAGLQGLLVTAGSTSESRTWQAAGLPYVVDCGFSVQVTSGGSLTIEAGATVKFATCASRDATIYVAGGDPSALPSLTVNGTQANPVTFTSLRDDSIGGDTNGDGAATIPMPGDWQAIHFDTYSAGSLNYADVRYGGSTYNGYDGAIHAVTTGSLVVTNSSFTNNANSGVRLASTGAATLTGNTFIVPAGAKAASMTAAADVSASGNTASGAGLQGLLVTYGAITNGNRTWQAAGLPYVVDCSFSVQLGSGGSLTIDPGVIVKFATCPNRDAMIYVAGSGPINLASLMVNGTQANPVTFTSLRDDSVGGDTNGDGAATVPLPGDWQAILFDQYQYRIAELRRHPLRWVRLQRLRRRDSRGEQRLGRADEFHVQPQYEGGPHQRGRVSDGLRQHGHELRPRAIYHWCDCEQPHVAGYGPPLRGGLQLQSPSGQRGKSDDWSRGRREVCDVREPGCSDLCRW